MRRTARPSADVRIDGYLACGARKRDVVPDAMKTSHALSLSSRRGGGCVVGGGEGDVLVVVLAGVQAVVQAAEESVEEVALGGGVAVAGGFAFVVVGSGAG